MKRPFFDEMLAHVQAHYPLEACGMMAGRAGQVTQLYAVENILHSRSAYEMDPRQQLAAMLDIEARSWDMLAIYHSHPNGPETPSPTDVAQAYYPDSIQVIISLRQPDLPSVRAFSIIDGRINEVALVVQP